MSYMILLACSIVCLFVYIRPIRDLFLFLLGGKTTDPFKIRETNELLNIGRSHCKQLFCWYL